MMHRTYNRSTDKSWSSDIYRKAKDVVVDVLRTRRTSVPFQQLLEVMKSSYPNLCDDNIMDPTSPKVPYWRHLVASAIQGLKSVNIVVKTDNGWILSNNNKTNKPKRPRSTEPVSPTPKLTTITNIKELLKSRLLQLDSKSFENTVGELLKVLGMEEVIVTGRTADGGIDAEGTIPIIQIKVAVQVKKYGPLNSVGIDPVQRLVGSVVAGGYDRGIFITTSSFTAGARETAEKTGSRITLIDMEKLVELMISKKIGVRQVPVVKDELDENFFYKVTE
jgi:HJR/Mrr/RecB family endonuclease